MELIKAINAAEMVYGEEYADVGLCQMFHIVNVKDNGKQIVVTIQWRNFQDGILTDITEETIDREDFYEAMRYLTEEENK